MDFFCWSPRLEESSGASNTVLGVRRSCFPLAHTPQISLAEIRQNRDQALVMIANKVDPGNIKKAQKAAETEESETFEVIAREWYAKFSPSWAVSHSTKIIRRLELYVFPWMGNRPIKSILAQDLLTVLRRIEAKGTLETAHRTQQTCGQVFRYAVATGRAERDPSGDLRGAFLRPVQSIWPPSPNRRKLPGYCTQLIPIEAVLLPVAPCSWLHLCLSGQENFDMPNGLRLISRQRNGESQRRR